MGQDGVCVCVNGGRQYLSEVYSSLRRLKFGDTVPFMLKCRVGLPIYALPPLLCFKESLHNQHS